jgi:hypothetical protein
LADLELRVPSLEALPQYVAALERGWSPDNVRGRAGAEDQLARIAEDPVAFLATQDDRDGKGPTGDPARRDCGEAAAGLLPLDLGRRVLRHGRVPLAARARPSCPNWCWATSATASSRGSRDAAMPPGAGAAGCRTARALGLPYVELTTDPANFASQKVITANGGVLVERFVKPESYGDGPGGLRYRIRALTRRDPPDNAAHVVGDEQGAAAVDGHADGAALDLVVGVRKLLRNTCAGTCGRPFAKGTKTTR